MTPLEVNDAQIAEWRAAIRPYTVIAAEIAVWTDLRRVPRLGRTIGYGGIARNNT